MSVSLGGTPQAVEFGAAMRDVRLAHNADLPTVAASLRIRQVYLQAIEDGRFDDLPGPTYASGFVRAYAEYLGLDIGEVMRRYREVTHGGGAQTPLVAPAPVSEGRMPTGFVLLVAAVLAAVVYGSWYYLTLHDRDAGEIVASLPQRIADMVGLGSSSETAAAPPQSAAAPPSAAALRMEVSAPTAPAVEQDAAAAEVKMQPVAAPPAPRPARPPVRPADRGEQEAALPPPQAEAESTSQPAPETSMAAAEPATAPDSQVASLPAPVSEPAPPTSLAPAPEPVAPAEALQPAVASEQAPEATATLVSAPPAPIPAPPAATAPSSQGRVVLRATGISWVELRDADGRRVFSRLLKKGETYTVPPQPGITLATGNAGAIDILVDGQAVAPIGPLGAVRRDILLEPDALLRGSLAGR